MSYWNNLNLQTGFNPYINTRLNVRFKGNSQEKYGVTYPNDDSFSGNGSKYFLTKEEIKKLAESSGIIKKKLKEYNLPLKVNIEELEELKTGHMMNSRVIASKILSGLPSHIKSQVNSSVLQQAAMLHDYGKVLIPKSILKKQGPLNESEREIMQLHPVFSYELLKQQGVDEDALRLIRYHHQNPNGDGYPAVEGNSEYNIASQIMRVSDEYTALTEDRSYKPAMTREEALNIIEEDVTNGYVSQEVFDSLKKAV